MQLQGKCMVPGSHIGCLVIVYTSLFIIALRCIFCPGHFEPPASRSRDPLEHNRCKLNIYSGKCDLSTKTCISYYISAQYICHLGSVHYLREEGAERLEHGCRNLCNPPLKRTKITDPLPFHQIPTFHAPHHTSIWYMSGFKVRVKTDISRWQATKYATLTQWGALINAGTPEVSTLHVAPNPGLTFQ